MIFALGLLVTGKISFVLVIAYNNSILLDELKKDVKRLEEKDDIQYSQFS